METYESKERGEKLINRINFIVETLEKIAKNFTQKSNILANLYKLQSLYSLMEDAIKFKNEKNVSFDQEVEIKVSRIICDWQTNILTTREKTSLNIKNIEDNIYQKDKKYRESINRRLVDFTGSLDRSPPALLPNNPNNPIQYIAYESSWSHTLNEVDDMSMFDINSLSPAFAI